MHYEILATATGGDGEWRGVLVVRREPWWTHAVFMAADRLCALTFHRIGCNRLVTPVSEWADKFTEEWKVPVSLETSAGLRRWQGREVWWEDTDE
ncbi:hypothetical protein [Amycolatopsis pithecellobii]|uniref:Uncharacterized protein n=1 Tax=Amycolatopsis pithecellobii TaxID=664692 RepID=A0A6N7Z531_9PSEU|nr:hypothetical protein [Amycolatopsis pithecellobii]MTD55711.1 hypothetical protein [Amycolatopsis pithecellobii]